MSQSLISATSYDENQSPQNLESEDEFTTTTGMFPQEFVVQIPVQREVKSVSFQGLNVKKWDISYNTEKNPYNWEVIFEKEEPFSNALVHHTATINQVSMKSAKITIHDSYSMFCSLNSLRIE